MDDMFNKGATKEFLTKKINLMKVLFEMLNLVESFNCEHE